MTFTPPPEVEHVVTTYLAYVDQEAPGCVEGLYLTGSTALGEFRPRTSDIDFVAVTSRRPDRVALTALGRAHNRLRKTYPRPHFDGLYVTWDDLGRAPQQSGDGPHSYEGRFHERGRRDCNPVTWHTLAQHGLRCRGPKPADISVWTDPAALASWTLENFTSYWRPLLGRANRFPDPWSLTAFTSYGAVWIVCGVCRPHYTLATGRIASKEEAGAHGLHVFEDRWHRVLNEALRIRRADRARPNAMSALTEIVEDFSGSLYPSPIARRRDVLAFADFVIADAEARFPVTRTGRKG